MVRDVLPIDSRQCIHERCCEGWRQLPFLCRLHRMQRDMDLIRQIMFEVEKCSGGFALSNLAIEGYTSEQITYHVWLLGQAGLMKVTETTAWGSSGPGATPVSLTWEGHDFIDTARGDTTWSHAREKVRNVGGSSFAVLKQLLEWQVKSQLGL